MNSSAHWPERLEFFYGSCNGFTGCRLFFQDGALWHGNHESLLTPSGKSKAVPCPVSEKQWLKFWQDVERIGVWDWSALYPNEHVLDGDSWQLELNYQGRQLKTEGFNAYPGAPDGPGFPARCAFGQFVAALRKLSGIKQI